LLEPKLQRIQLSSNVIKTEDELRAWLQHQGEELSAKLTLGPIVIG
jgi:hypothetical protein